ncbi:MAG: cob(I)yrinic acid a,c-diamide adenosyltransferase [Firmicutes bacterium]|nr:cob(I)yrinic acid a,c-diamide adenosyltransferase [Bacillota bacterium]
MLEEKGLVIVYTGDGKGKTTAALGLALRQVGHGGRVLFLQFLKGSSEVGEHKAAQNIPGLEIIPCGREGFIIGEPSSIDYRLAKEGLDRARKALADSDYTMVVLDELHVAISLGLIPVAEALDLLNRRGSTHLVTTGRGAPSEIVMEADIVSEVKEVKHDYHTGRKAAPGIEY